MAHTCPNCYAYCTCNGDWDDINFVGDDPECMHCEDDLFPDDDDDAEQNMHWTGGGGPACAWDNVAAPDFDGCNGCEYACALGRFPPRSTIYALNKNHKEKVMLKNKVVKIGAVLFAIGAIPILIILFVFILALLFSGVDQSVVMFGNNLVRPLMILMGIVLIGLFLFFVGDVFS